jgi:Ni/Co efflux regulator RcnB
MENRMNNKTIVSVIVAMTLASGGSAFAQGNSNHNNRGRDEQMQRHEQKDRRYDERRQPDHRDYGNRAHNNERWDERGAGPNHDFRRGERLPVYYRHSQYVVDDWRGYHLSAPPRGYHWIQTGGDYVLVAIATGVIVQLLLNN